MRILNLSCPVVLKMCYEFRVFITDDLWPLWKVNLKHERKCELLESVDELSEALWCCVSWCWCCIGRGKSISVFVSQCPGGGSQGYERDLLVDLRLLWPPANCTDISRIFSDKLGSVKLLSFRKRIILSCSLLMRCWFLCQVLLKVWIVLPAWYPHFQQPAVAMWGWLGSAFCLGFLSPLSWRVSRLTTSGQRRDKDGEERRGRQL